MRVEFVKINIEVDYEFSIDFCKIINLVDDFEIILFMKLFWEQQRKLFFSSVIGVRFYFMIIRFCLLFVVKSLLCYEELRNSKVLVFFS